MTVIATLDGKASVTAGADESADLRARVADTEPSSYTSTVMPFLQPVVKTNLAAGLNPADYSQRGVAGLQVLGPLRLYADGVEVPPRHIASIAVQEQLDGATTFDVTLARVGQRPDSFEDPLGSPAECWGPPGIAQSLRVTGTYLTDAGPLEIVLVENGLTDNAAVAIGRDGQTLEISGIDASGRHDRRRADIVHPPGHGLTRTEVIARALESAGVTNYRLSLDDDPQTFKEIAAPNTEVIGWARPYLEAIWHRLRWAKDGVPELVPDRDPDGRLDISRTFNLRHLLLDDRIGTTQDGDGPTCVKVATTKQRTHEGTGLRTEETVTEVYQVYAPKAVEYQISSTAGALSATGFSDGQSILRLVRRTTVQRTFELDVEVLEVTTNEEWFNPEEAVGSINTLDGSITYTIGDWVETDSGPGRNKSIENFRERTRVEHSWEYDADGYLVREIEESYDYHQRRAAHASLTLGGLISSWINNDVNWNLDAVTGGQSTAQQQLVRRVTTTYDVSDGFVTGEQRMTEEWAKRPGRQYLWNKGETSQDASQSFLEVERVETTYEQIAEHQVSVTTVQTALGAEGPTITTGSDTSLPPAERRETRLPDPDIYPNGKLASGSDLQLVEVEFCHDGLAECRPEAQDEVNNQYLENEDEAMAYARELVARQAAFGVGFSVPLDLSLRAGLRVELAMPEVGVEYDRVVIRSLRHSMTPQQGARTTIEGRAYVT